MNRSEAALVTGASRGIGAALCRRLVAQGWRVQGVYRQAHEAAQAVRRDCPGLGLSSADLGEAEGIQAVVRAQSEPLDVVVFHAGMSYRAAFVDAGDPDPLREQLRVDLEAPLLLCRALLDAQALRSGARLVFVSSNLAQRGLPGKVAYSAAKAGIEGAVRGLARELGPAKMRVNAVAPGLLRSDMTAELGEAGYHAYATDVPLGRVGEPQDVVGAIEFLLSPASAYITGQVLNVDGGWSA